MSASRTVSVVIPSWNTLEFLPRCLESLGSQGVDLQPMVVDNGSTDGSAGYLEREGIPHVLLPQNVGFAAAVNLGVRRVASRSILVLNADTVLEPGCVGELFDAMSADAALGGVQPRILQLEGDPAAPRPIAGARIYSAGQALTGDGRAFEQGMGGAQRPEFLAKREIFGACGAACLLRRELFDVLGGYAERYFAFYEDVDLNVRAQIAGWRFGYVPDAVVWHVGNASWNESFEKPAADNARLVARNRLATQVKFMPVKAVPRIAIVEVGSLLRAAHQGRFLATLRGKLAALRWLPSLFGERRSLREEGDLSNVRHWLGRPPVRR